MTRGREGMPAAPRAARVRRASRRAASAAALTLALASLAACAVFAPVVPPVAPAAPEGLRAELLQLRADVAFRQAQVRIHNGADSALQIGRVEVIDGRLRGPATRVVERVSRIAPGASVDVRVQLPPVDCDAPDAAESHATLELASSGGAEVVVPLEEDVPFLAALHERECVEASAREVAEVAFGDFMPSAAGTPASLALVVTPAAAAEGTLAITGIRETNLLTFDGVAEGVHPLSMTVPSTGAQTISLPLVPARCDPHAVQEDKRGTVFRLLVAVDGVEGSFDLVASPPLRGAILDWVTRWCGYG